MGHDRERGRINKKGIVEDRNGILATRVARDRQTWYIAYPGAQRQAAITGDPGPQKYTGMIDVKFCQPGLTKTDLVSCSLG
jgi:hypothetical protein